MSHAGRGGGNASGNNQRGRDSGFRNARTPTSMNANLAPLDVEDVVVIDPEMESGNE